MQRDTHNMGSWEQHFQYNVHGPLLSTPAFFSVAASVWPAEATLSISIVCAIIKSMMTTLMALADVAENLRNLQTSWLV